MVSLTTVASLCVDSIPTLVLPITSCASKIKYICQTRKVFQKAALVGSSSMFCVGVFSWFNATNAMILAYTVSASGEAVVDCFLLFVATQTTVAINQRSAQQPSETAQAFYKKAKCMVTMQACGLCLSSLVYIAATYMVNFTYFGMHTAVLVYLVKFTVSMLWLCTAVHFTEPEQSRQVRRSLLPTISTPYSPFSSGAKSDTLSAVGGQVWRPQAVIKVRVYSPATNAILPDD
ncbi:unnamed protein product [Ectocarpus sp. 6 AP-2014]